MNHITVDHTWIEQVKVDGAPVERERVVHLEISGPATLRMGISRSLLIEGQKALWEKEKDDLVDQGFDLLGLFAQQILRTQMYPSLIAAVTKQEGFNTWPIAFEEFMELPEELGIKWEEAVGKLNPHWAPEIPPETQEELEEARKKAMNGTPESSNG